MWPRFKGRDGCRTPLPWSTHGPYAEFSDTAPWLPFAEEHRPLAAGAQMNDPGSVFVRCRRFLAFRRTQRALVDGAMALLPAHDDVVAWTRGQGDDAIVCIFNLSPRAARYALDGLEADALDGHGFAGALARSHDGATLECVLPPNGAFFGRIRANPQPARSQP